MSSLAGGVLVLRWSRSLPLVATLLACPSGAIVVPDLGATGTYLRPSGQASGFLVGSGGAVEELDAFVAVTGRDLNDASQGTAARLSSDPLPADLGLAFSSALLDGDAVLRLRYDLTNLGADAIDGLAFLSFLDAEIDEEKNTFFNEYATTSGSLAAGEGFEVDEPGFTFGDIYTHLLAGSLDGTNAVPLASPDDVSMALSFAVASLAPGQTARFDVFVSENGTATGFRIDQHDVESPTVITLSGAASAVPEPASGLLLGAGLAGLGLRARRTRSSR